MKFLIDKTELPYDAMVPDASWLIPLEEETDGEDADDAEVKEIQADKIQGEGFGV